MTGRTPRARALGLEHRPSLPDIDAERFAGYGVMGLSFTLGDVLAFRRVAASSIGPSYTSVWHRDPRGRWTVFVDRDPHVACPRYLGAALDRAVQAEVRVEWPDPWSVSVTVPTHQLDWAVRLEDRPGTRLWSALAGLLPRRSFREPGKAVLVGGLGGRLLATAPLQLRGRAPNGQWFAVRPARLWAATASAAVVGSRDLGPLGPLPRAAHVGDMVLPERGLFMTGEWLYESHEPGRHRPLGTVPPDAGDALRLGA